MCKTMLNHTDQDQVLGIDSESNLWPRSESALALLQAGDSQQAAALLGGSVMDAERQLR